MSIESTNKANAVDELIQYDFKEFEQKRSSLRELISSDNDTSRVNSNYDKNS